MLKPTIEVLRCTKRKKFIIDNCYVMASSSSMFNLSFPGESGTQNISASGEEAHDPRATGFRSDPIPDYKFSPGVQSSRMSWVSTINWTTTQAVGTAVYNQSFPGNGTALTLISQIQADPFTNFRYWRGDIKVKVDVSATKFHTGKLLVGCGIMDPVNLLDAIYQSPHAIVDATGASSIIVSSPFINQFEAVDTTTEQFWVYALVLQQLQAATGSSTTVPISVSVAFPNSSFYVMRSTVLTTASPSFPTPVKVFDSRKKKRSSSVPPVEFAPHGNSIAKYNVYNLRAGGNLSAPIEQKGDNLDAKNEVDPTMSTAVGVGGSTADAALTPAISDQHTPPKMVGPDVGATSSRDRDKNGIIDTVVGAAERYLKPKVEKFFGGTAKSQLPGFPDPSAAWNHTTGAMDLVGSMLDPVLVQTASRPNYNSACNVEAVTSMRVYSGAETIVTEKDAFSMTDQMRFDWLVRQPFWVTTYTLNTSTPSGNILASFPIHPTLQTQLAGTDYYNSPQAMGWMTLLSLYSTFWTGDIDFTFIFGTSAFTSGKLLFSFEFNTTGPASSAPTTLAGASSQYNVVYDLASQDKRLTLRVPYMQPHPTSYVVQGPNSATGSADNLYDYLIYNGTCTIYVLNPMAANSGAPGTLEIEMYMAAGPNFQLAGIYPFNQLNLVDEVLWNQMGQLVTTTVYSPSLAGAATSLMKSAVPRPSPPKKKHNVPKIRSDHASSMGFHLAQGDDSVTTSAYSTDTSTWASEAIVVVPRQRIFPIASMSGERNASLRDLMKCRWPFWQNMIAEFATTGPISGTGENQPPPYNCFPVHSVFSYCPYLPAVSAFYAMRGSLRLTLEFTNCWLNTGAAVADYPDGDAFNYCVYGVWVENLAAATNASGFQSLPLILAAAATGTSYGYDTLAGHEVASGRSTNIRQFKLSQDNPSVTLEIPQCWHNRIVPISSLLAPVQNTGLHEWPEYNVWSPWGWIFLFSAPTSNESSTPLVSMYAGVGDDFRLLHNYLQPMVLNQNPYKNPGWP